MGHTYHFSCPECGYSAEVSGGDDWGFFCRTTTVRCIHCKIVADVVTSETPSDDKSVKSVTDLKCPNCSGPVEKWDGLHCPKCEGEMENQRLVWLWD